MRLGRALLLLVVVALAAALGAVAWMATGPGPLAFAGGSPGQVYAGASPLAMMCTSISGVSSMRSMR